MPDITSHEIDAFGRQIVVAVSNDDIFTAPIDAAAFKYAQAFHGADLEAHRRLRAAGLNLDPPSPGETARVAAGNSAKAQRMLFVGTVPLSYFEYAEIRDLSRRAVAAAADPMARIAHLGMTVHGVGIGLDESEAFIAQLAGFLDALRRDEWPASLDKITIFERNQRRAERLATVVDANLPRKIAEQARRQIVDGAIPAIESAGIGSREKRHVFVAMQFGAEMDDLFHYAIEAPIRAAGFLCERIDTLSFTGDILAQIKARIDSATFVVAELSAANPNVYLEVGYAWGRNIKTILLVREVDRLKFDVQGQRCLVYTSMRQLEQALCNELQQLATAF